MAGGYGTRLRPLTIKQPKPMIPIANRPMLEHIVRLLIKHDFKEILMLTYFFPETIEEYFGDGSQYGVNIHYRQDPPGGLGTAGAVKGVSDLIDDTFLVISGDVITDFDLTEAVNFHKNRSDLTTMVLTHVHNPLPFGVVITDEENRVVRFLEKPSWGEVFSDTINTGIYILEPEVLDRIPEDVQKDFSGDIFPDLLTEGRAPGAFVAAGYWKDVGNTVEYLQTHREIAAGLVNLYIPGERSIVDDAVVYAGEGTVIGPDARLSGLVVIDDGAVVEDGARVRDSFIGAGVTVSGNVRMRSSVVWNGVAIERGAFIAGSVIGSKTNIRTRANIEEGAIISENCNIGRGSIVRAGIRVWPDKVVEDEAILSSDFVWGTRWRGTLFTSGIIKGLANREVTPEFAARLGAAFGATFPESGTVSLSRGMHRSARMISEALAAGILSAGVDVHDYRVVPIPVSRHQMRGQGEMGGVHVRRAPSDPEVIEVRLYREDGRELTTSERNEVDRLFFRMDFRRSGVEDSGDMTFPYHGTEVYEKNFLKNIDVDRISGAKFRVVVDYSFGSTLKVLPALLGKIRSEIVSLNSHLDDTKATRTTKQFDRAVKQISEIVKDLQTAFGAIISASGETLFLVDENGRWVDGSRMLQVLALLAFRTNPGCSVAVSASASRNFEELAQTHGGKVIRTPINPSALLDTAATLEVFLAGNGEGGVSFPWFHPSFDAMFTLGKLLEMMSITGDSLGSLVDSLPVTHLLHSIVPCPWETKGKVMRHLVEELGEDAQGIEGVQFNENDGWVLIYPSSNHACIHIFAESHDLKHVNEMLRIWSQKVEEMQTHE